MAVTISLGQLAVALRLATADDATIPPAQVSVLTRSLESAREMVLEYAPTAPDAVANEAVIRLASRLYDQAGSEGRGGNPFVTSGAAQLLTQFRSRKALATSSAAGETPTGTPGFGGAPTLHRTLTFSNTSSEKNVTAVPASATLIGFQVTVEHSSSPADVIAGIAWVPIAVLEAGDRTGNIAAVGLSQYLPEADSDRVNVTRSAERTYAVQPIVFTDGNPGTAQTAIVRVYIL